MKKKQLEILLERIDGFNKPIPEMEQYVTPASVAADMLYLAYLHGDVSGRDVCDLGTGTGMLAIGAALLGARSIGVDIDKDALKVARANAQRIGADVEFVCGEISSVALRRIDTVIMNPPFGAQKASIGDRAFLSKAKETANVIYTLHNRGSEGFIRGFVEPCTVEEIYRIPFPMKRCFEFHSKDIRTIEVELYRIVC